MKSAPIPDNESQRLAALCRFRILDSDREDAFDDFTHLASVIAGTPIALISLVDEKRQWFKSRTGLEALETPREISFCGHAVGGSDVLQVPDTWEDERFFDNPLVSGEPKIRSYTGAPLLAGDGQAIGTLCVIDRVPRKLTDGQLAAIQTLARQVVRQMELRLLVAGEHERNQRLNADLDWHSSLRLKELQKTTEDLQGLSYFMAHDLRQPVISVSGFSDLLKKSNLGDTERRYVDRISSGINQIGVRLDALLYFSNLLSKPLRRTTVDLRELADRHLNAMKATNPAREVVADIPSLLTVHGDAELLERVIVELLNNAWQASSTQDVTRLKLGSQIGPDGEISYMIHDNGVGFDMAYVDQMFEPFQKSNVGHNNDKHGVGLARVKRIIAKHGGRVWIESSIGQGAAIFFTLGTG